MGTGIGLWRLPAGPFLLHWAGIGWPTMPLIVRPTLGAQMSHAVVLWISWWPPGWRFPFCVSLSQSLFFLFSIFNGNILSSNRICLLLEDKAYCIWTSIIQTYSEGLSWLLYELSENGREEAAKKKKKKSIFYSFMPLFIVQWDRLCGRVSWGLEMLSGLLKTSPRQNLNPGLSLFKVLLFALYSILSPSAKRPQEMWFTSVDLWRVSLLSFLSLVNVAPLICLCLA